MRQFSRNRRQNGYKYRNPYIHRSIKITDFATSEEAGGKPIMIDPHIEKSNCAQHQHGNFAVKVLLHGKDPNGNIINPCKYHTFNELEFSSGKF